MKVWAYEFTCEKSCYEMEMILNEVGPWKWRIRDCDWYPDFLECHSNDVRMCIYEQRGLYRCLIESRSSSGVERALYDPMIVNLLNKIPINNLKEISSFEWPFD
jgi:hypothetical protein